jgi:integrase
VVRAKAVAGDVVGKRDYALLLFYLVTGMRRQEVISLRGGDIKIDEYITLTGKVKGGDYVGREVRDPLLREAILDYLSSCGREGVLKTGVPLWTRHDRAGRPGAALTSHAFVKNLKRYAREAGVGDVHLHQRATASPASSPRRPAQSSTHRTPLGTATPLPRAFTCSGSPLSATNTAVTSPAA